MKPYLAERYFLCAYRSSAKMLRLLLPSLFFLLHLSIPYATALTPYQPTDYFLLNCGSSANETFNWRNWEPDSHLKFLAKNMADISSTATASEGYPPVDRVPYGTARIFHSQFTYAFPLSPGPKFLRLYFYPATYSGGLNTTQSFFTVTANDYTLLSNFSAFLTVSAANPPKASLVKEFIINVKDNQILNLTFSPSSNSYCFVNGIEIVSMPNNLYLRHDDSIKNVDLNSLFHYDVNNTAFETLYRLDVGGSHEIPVVDDTGMFRQWSLDDNFIYPPGYKGNPMYYKIPIRYTKQTPNYTAPERVYTTARAMGTFADRYQLTWIFPVDSGFYYLLRLHFCEISPKIYTQSQRVFQITMNNKTAEAEFDVIYRSGGKGIPIYRDYIVFVPKKNPQVLKLALFPSMGSKPELADAILNGLEVFKLNSSDGNLAGPNPERLVNPNTSESDPKGWGKKSSKSRAIIYAAIGGVVGASAMLLILVFLMYRRQKRLKDLEKIASKSSCAPLSVSSRSTKTCGSSLPSDLCRNILLQKLKSATADFDDNFVIGRGGFGKVYKGYIDNGATNVAIKRLNPSSSQGAHEFTTEIEMLSKLRHPHLVSLIGYCDEQSEMILVYEYMANGTLRDHLYKTKNPPLPWKQRLQICIGAAKGLDYLHTGEEQNIIHRDVKSTNILLDEKWAAKVSDFGLSRIGPSGENQSHVSTSVKGSLGYMDPEYYKKQQLTDKSDVYSFGVVLLEVLCARPAIMSKLRQKQVNLANWGRLCFTEGTIDGIVDRNVKDEIAAECLAKYAEIATNCLKDRGIERPAMSEVVSSLEIALQLQEEAENAGHVMSSSSASKNHGHGQPWQLQIRTFQPRASYLSGRSSDDQRNISETEVERPSLLITDKTQNFLKLPGMDEYIGGELAKALAAN